MDNIYSAVASIMSAMEENAAPDFRGIALYGKIYEKTDAQNACQIYSIKNETGTGEISCYQVFPGVELFYNDLHAAYCIQEQKTAKNMIEINHCREGRYECGFGESDFCYMTEGDLSIGALTRKKSYSCFPLNHYHGITIFINLAELMPEVRAIMSMLGIDLERIQRYVCDENRFCLMRANPSVEHIFSELYCVREQRRAGYMKVKILELLLFLSDLDADQEHMQSEYFSQAQVRLIKEVAHFITADLVKHYTIEQLAQQFHVSATNLKKCFKGVYGSSIYAYLKTYRLQTAEKLLLETLLPVAEIATKVGYENPSKFAVSFKKAYGEPPTDFRKRGRR